MLLFLIFNLYKLFHMKFSTIASAFVAASSVLAAPLAKRDDEPLTNKTILLTNDDGWAATNIRATYTALKNAGYEVIMVAPVLQRSGFGGQFAVPTSETLETNGEFSYPPAGSPSWGHEDEDQSIWYFNGTPASCVAFGLNYVIPQYFDNKTVDLVVAGPNEGLNLSPGMYTLSGTIGATYASVLRGYPAIAFSGSNTNNSFYKDDEDRLDDETFTPVIYGKKVVELVDRLFTDSESRPRVLPKTTGLNVNLPKVGDEDESCLDPEWQFARLSGEDSPASNLKYADGKVKYADGFFEAPTECVFGDCDLPSEAWVIKHQKCKTPISVFSIDYDASYKQAKNVQNYLGELFA